MLGQNAVMNRKDTEYTTAFLENKAIDTGCIGATNIEITNKSLIPAAMQGSYITSKVGPDGKSHDYLRGYIQPADGSIASTPVGVPMQPGDQPHLVSNKTFTSEIAAPFGAGVPPNGFRSASAAAEQKSGNNASTLACSEVGSLNMTFPMSAPYGYIMIVNGPDTGGTDSVPGPFVGLDHVLNNELLNPGGIFVGSNVFSTDKGLLDNWAQFNSDPQTYMQKNAADPVGFPIDKSTGQPPLQGVNSADSSSPTPIFKLDGTPATAGDMANMKFSGTGMNATANGVTCTDSNSTSDGNSTCYNLLTNPAQPNDAFDKAYHPGGGYTTGAGTTDNGDGGGLLAVECAKCQLQHKFNTCTDLTIDNGNCGQTGLRVPRAGTAYGVSFGNDWRNSEAPSSTTNCQISQDSTINGLGNFVQDGFGDTLDQLISTRCLQIIPSNLTGKGDGAAQYNATIKNTTLGLGKTYFIYAPNPDATPPGSGKSDSAMDLVIDTTGPSWRKAGTTTDGKPVSATHANYNITGTAVNPHHDRGIHDIMYRDHPDAGINATDTATWTPSTGFENLLGKCQFTESASGYAAGFCKPD
jgi:hypothetical protein